MILYSQLEKQLDQNKKILVAQYNKKSFIQILLEEKKYNIVKKYSSEIKNLEVKQQADLLLTLLSQLSEENSIPNDCLEILKAFENQGLSKKEFFEVTNSKQQNVVMLAYICKQGTLIEKLIKTNLDTNTKVNNGNFLSLIMDRLEEEKRTTLTNAEKIIAQVYLKKISNEGLNKQNITTGNTLLMRSLLIGCIDLSELIIQNKEKDLDYSTPNNDNLSPYTLILNHDQLKSFRDSISQLFLESIKNDPLSAKKALDAIDKKGNTPLILMIKHQLNFEDLINEITYFDILKPNFDGENALTLTLKDVSNKQINHDQFLQILKIFFKDLEKINNPKEIRVYLDRQIENTPLHVYLFNKLVQSINMQFPQFKLTDEQSSDFETQDSVSNLLAKTILKLYEKPLFANELITLQFPIIQRIIINIPQFFEVFLNKILKHDETLTKLLNIQDNNGNTPLHTALLQNASFANLLLTKAFRHIELSLPLTNHEGSTPLILTFQQEWNLPTLTNIILILKANACNVVQINKHGYSALYYLIARLFTRYNKHCTPQFQRPAQSILSSPMKYSDIFNPEGKHNSGEKGLATLLDNFFNENVDLFIPLANGVLPAISLAQVYPTYFKTYLEKVVLETDQKKSQTALFIKKRFN